MASSRAIAASTRQHDSRGHNRWGKLNPHDLADLKANCKCTKCGRFDHSSEDDGRDGELPDFVPSSDDPSQSDWPTEPDAGKRGLCFNQARVITASSGHVTMPYMLGLLLPDAVTYSTIGLNK